LTTKE